MGRNWLVICSEALFVVQIVLVTSISHCIMEQPPSHEEESDSDSAVKKFIEAKRAMHDDRCYDVVSNQQLRKELKLSKRQYYGTLKAMREGREVGVSGRPSYLRDSEKINFWNWVRMESQRNRPPSTMDMVEYVNRIVRTKRPVLMNKRSTVSKRYVRNLLKEGGLSLDPRRKVYVTNVKATVRNVNEFFQRFGMLLHQLHISEDMIFSMEEIHIPQEESIPFNVVPSSITEKPPRASYFNEDATVIGCISASGQLLPRAYVITPDKWSDSIWRETFIPPSRIYRSEKGRLTDPCMREWILGVFLPWVQERRRLFGWKEAVLIADAHDGRFNKEIVDLLNSNQVFVALIPPGATTFLLPLYSGLYPQYLQSLKLYLKPRGVVETLRASENAFSETFTLLNIFHAWERTTILSEDHSSVFNWIPKEVNRAVKGEEVANTENGVNDSIPENGVNDSIPDNPINNSIPDNSINNSIPDNPINNSIPENATKNPQSTSSPDYCIL